MISSNCVTKPFWVDEVYGNSRYGLLSTAIIDQQSPYQKISIINSVSYGTGLLLDGCWMTAEHQECCYHEAIVHPALTTAESVKRILIIGGGDGGTARECLRYSEVESVDLVEIDGLVIELSQHHLPTLGQNVWYDPRLRLIVEDGITWVGKVPDSSYDVIIVDCSDPVGPAEGLFNRSFIQECRRILIPGGVFTTQSESPEASRKIHLDTVQLIRSLFEYADPMYGWVPMYPSGWWSWTFAAIDTQRYLYPKPNRVNAIIDTCEIWNPRWQSGAFDAIPNSIARVLKND
uniref:Spermidine synthase n=1 Tax=Paulinella micropora TaxID=1928728 RepID=A0A385I087_9EUKA|nr:spermidine synthase [Paulinella micropora]AXY63321.1 spermidine synthase [Paulinella micropora]